MSRLFSCLVLAALANGCAISATVGTAPVAPAGAQVAYLPPPTAHAAPTPAQPVAQPAAQPAAPPAGTAARPEQPAGRPWTPATGGRRTSIDKKTKLREKDVRIVGPLGPLQRQGAPLPPGRLASTP